MYDIVGAVLWAIEKLFLDQDACPFRNNSRWVSPLGPLFPRPFSSCPPLPTLPGAASAVLPSCRGSLPEIVFYQVPTRTYKYTKVCQRLIVVKQYSSGDRVNVSDHTGWEFDSHRDHFFCVLFFFKYSYVLTRFFFPSGSSLRSRCIRCLCCFFLFFFPMLFVLRIRTGSKWKHFSLYTLYTH